MALFDTVAGRQGTDHGMASSMAQGATPGTGPVPVEQQSPKQWNFRSPHRPLLAGSRPTSCYTH
jgi:hypothetical protein